MMKRPQLPSSPFDRRLQLMVTSFARTALVLIVPVVLTAQAPAASRDSVRMRGVATVNPFALFAKYAAGDVEFAAGKAVTLGVGGTFNAIDDYNDYRALEFKARYYPAERALRGFAVAATVGVVAATDREFPSPREIRRRRPTIGTELSYQWILGPAQRFVVVGGLGVKRLLGTEGNVDPINIPLLPTARVSIGVAF